MKLQKIEGYIKDVRSSASLIFLARNNYSSLCSNGLLNGYSTEGKQLLDINNNIIKQGGKRPVCFSNAKDFCVSTQFTDGSYLCVDKNYIIGKIKCVSAQTVCK